MSEAILNWGRTEDILKLECMLTAVDNELTRIAPEMMVARMHIGSARDQLMDRLRADLSKAKKDIEEANRKSDLALLKSEQSLDELAETLNQAALAEQLPSC